MKEASWLESVGKVEQNEREWWQKERLCSKSSHSIKKASIAEAGSVQENDHLWALPLYFVCHLSFSSFTFILHG